MKRSLIFALCLLTLAPLAGCTLPKTEPFRVRQSQFPDRLSYLRYCDHYWLHRTDICVD